MRKKIILGLGGVVVLALLIQFIPINRQDPPAVTQVIWYSPETEELFERACADCHSSQTTWPWYSYVAPVSWLVARDVYEGREEFNMDDLTTRPLDRLANAITQVMEEGEMPMPIYLVTHPEARLTADENAALSQGLRETLTLSGAAIK